MIKPVTLVKSIYNYLNPFQWFLITGMVFTSYLAGGLYDPISAICSIAGVVCVVLVGKGSIHNYLFGVVNVVLYIIISYNAKLYGETMLNVLYYLPIQFIGFFLWKRNISKDNLVFARNLSKSRFALVVLVSILSIIVYAQVLVCLGDVSPYLDSTTTVLSIVAQILMLLRLSEQWLLWVVVNVCSIAMWLMVYISGTESALIMALMWTFYLINSVYGYINWRSKLSCTK